MCIAQKVQMQRGKGRKWRGIGKGTRERGARGNFKRGAGGQVDRCKGNFKSGAGGRGSCISFDSGSGNCCCCLRRLRLHVTSLAIGAFVNTPAPPFSSPSCTFSCCTHPPCLPLVVCTFSCLFPLFVLPVFFYIFSPNFHIRIHACLLCVCVCVLVCARVCVCTLPPTCPHWQRRTAYPQLRLVLALFGCLVLLVTRLVSSFSSTLSSCPSPPPPCSWAAAAAYVMGSIDEVCVGCSKWANAQQQQAGRQAGSSSGGSALNRLDCVRSDCRREREGEAEGGQRQGSALALVLAGGFRL